MGDTPSLVILGPGGMGKSHQNCISCFTRIPHGGAVRVKRNGNTEFAGKCCSPEELERRGYEVVVQPDLREAAA